jgi:esterase/lipase superfamily enzyme
MGGQGALLFAFKYPELFGAVGGYGAGLANGVELQKELPAVFQKMHDNSVAQFDSTSTWYYVVKNADKIRGHVAIRLALGDGDQHLSRNHHMKQVLEELKIPFQYEELPGVGHNAKLVYQMVGVKGWQFQLAHPRGEVK